MPTTYLTILSKLIGFDTTTKRDTLDAVNWVKDYFSTFNINAKLIYNTSRTRASLIATVGDPDQPGLILSGHLDTVPALTSDWTTDPWTLTQKDDRFYGRGTTDMKGAIAVALSLVPEMIKSGKTFTFSLTHDEEIGGNAIRETITDPAIQKILENATGCIVMESTDLSLVIGQKTVVIGNIDLTGVTVHSSDPARGTNALHHAIQIYNLFYKTLKSFQQEQDSLFKIPYAVADIVVLNSGTAINMIPDHAHMEYSGRFFTHEQQTEFTSELDRKITEYQIGKEPLSITHSFEKGGLPGFNMSLDHPFVKKLRDFAPLAQEAKVSYGTEAGHFANRHIPTVILGPGSINNAHEINESIAQSELDGFEKILTQIIHA